jgi:hypothetical protein
MHSPCHIITMDPAAQMIEFSCLCGYHFAVPQDLSGGLVQCPTCKRLNDVPLLGDLANIDDDGIFKLDDAPRLKDDPKRVAKLTYVFTRDHYDADGKPIDNRLTPQELAKVDQDIVPLEPARAMPKYDPVSGELIREVDVKPEADTSAIPMARRARQAPPKVINGMDVPDALELIAIPFRLLKPVNLLVMSFIFLAQVLNQVMFACIATFYLVLLPVWAIIHALVLSHFGNVIDETGPVSRQELPTPLRSVTREDTITPLGNILMALAACYSPAIILLVTGHNMPVRMVAPVSGALAIAGSVLFPAALLITSTSGSYVNLRPDRILGTALVCGVEYVAVLLVFVAGAVFYVGGVIAASWVAAGFLVPSMQAPDWMRWYLAYAALIVGIYLLHLFCWHLGTLYRKHHARFPWAYQRHASDRPKGAPTGFPIGRPVPKARARQPGQGNTHAQRANP